jgi:hypothetical protein
MGNTKEGKNHIINCGNGIAESIFITEGGFIKVKNFTPGTDADSSDQINFEKKDANAKAYYFKDVETGKVYAFMTDKNDKITGGVIVEYGGHQDILGIKTKEMQDPSFLEKVMSLGDAKPTLTDVDVKLYNGDTKDKEEIKAYLKDKTKDHSGALEVTQAVSKPHLLDAVGGLASTNAKVDNDFKTSGAGFDKGSNQVG